MTRQPIPISALQHRGDSLEEHQRLRGLFERLKAEASRGQRLTMAEYKYVCKGILMAPGEDGMPWNYSYCQDCWFMFLYSLYHQDMSGAYRPAKLHFREELLPNDELLIHCEEKQVSVEEAQIDLAFLEKKAIEWEPIMMDDRHQDQLLREASKEGRQLLKELKSQPEFKNDTFYQGRFAFRNKKQQIVLFSKWIYLFASEVFEQLDPEHRIGKLNGTDIELNEYGLIHILSRHFAPKAKGFDTGKSFIKNLNFEPRKLLPQVRLILQIIDVSGLFEQQPIDAIIFRIGSVIMELRTREVQKGVKGKGMVSVRRLETLFPVDDQKKLSKITAEYEEKTLDPDFSVFVRCIY